MDTLDTLQTYQEKLYQAVLHHPVYGKSAHARSELYTFLLTQATEPATFVPVSQREAVISSLLNAWYSYDAIQSAIDDPLVTDIHVMGDRTVLRKEGRLYESTESRFATDDRLVEFVKRKLEKTPFSYSLADPVTDAMLPEGYRLNVIGGQNTGYSVVGDDHRIETATMATIRKPIMPFRMEQLIRLGMMNQELADLVKGMAIVGDSFVIAGGVGSGKTTLLNALTEYMDGYINCAIEEMGEMVPLSNWWIRLTDRMGNAQGIGAITMERNMMNTLRMDVDNVILGEARWPAITWLFIRLSMLTKRMVGTTFHTRVDVGRGVHHVLQRMILEATAGSQGVSTNANTASLLADNVRFIFALDNVNGSPRMTEVGYIEDYDAVTQEVTWCKVAYWDYFEKTWVFQGVPASFLLRANIKGIHLPFTVYEGPRETYRVPKEG